MKEWLESAHRGKKYIWHKSRSPNGSRNGIWVEEHLFEVTLIHAVVEGTGNLRRCWPLGCCDRQVVWERKDASFLGLDEHRRDYGSRNAFSQPHHAGAYKLAPVERQQPACSVLEQLEHNVSAYHSSPVRVNSRWACVLLYYWRAPVLISCLRDDHLQRSVSFVYSTTWMHSYQPSYFPSFPSNSQQLPH